MSPWPVGRRGALLISWFSCEANVHHLLGETIFPLWSAVANVERLILPTVVVADGAEWWARPNDACHGTRLSPLLALLPIDHSLLLGPGRAAGLTAGREASPEGPPPLRCFASSEQQPTNRRGSAGLTQGFYHWLASASGVCKPPLRAASGGADVLLVLRLGTRRMIDAGQVERRLRSVPGVRSLRTADFASLGALEQVRPSACSPVAACPPGSCRPRHTLALHEQHARAHLHADDEPLRRREQLQFACAAHIVVGVHGQANEWAHFVDGARGRGGGLLEIAYEGCARAATLAAPPA